MKRLILPVLLIPTLSYAAIPDYQCWDIYNNEYSTDSSLYATRYIDKMPAPYGSAHYATAPNEANYSEIIIVNEQHSDGYYYGDKYQNKQGTLYLNLKCKKQ